MGEKKEKLVLYSDSSDDETHESTENHQNTTHNLALNDNSMKRKIGKSPPEIDDLPLLKKIRANPHVEGNFASYAFLKIPTQCKLLTWFLNMAKETQALKDFSPSWVKMEDEEFYHISLSKTFYLNLHQIDIFKGKFEASLKASVDPFYLNIHLNDNCIFANEGRTRFFFSLEIKKSGNKEINILIHRVDTVMKDFNFDQYYEERRPHISLLWTLEWSRKTNKAEEFPYNFQDCASPVLQKGDMQKETLLKVDAIYLKIGQTITPYKLTD